MPPRNGMDQEKLILLIVVVSNNILLILEIILALFLGGLQVHFRKSLFQR